MFAAPGEDLTKQRRSPAGLGRPLVDASALYMFRSYEEHREDFVTLIANYNPLQDPNGQPMTYPLDSSAFYTIYVDNDGDGIENISFRFKINLTLNPNQGLGIEGLVVPVPLTAPEQFVPIGISQTFAAGPGSADAGASGSPPARDERLNWIRTYTLRVLRGGPDDARDVEFVTNSGTGNDRFSIPADYASVRQFPDYDAYEDWFMHEMEIPGCEPVVVVTDEGEETLHPRVFVGQRQMSHNFNSGEFFSLVGIPDFTGNRAERFSSFRDKNVTSLALEVPIDCLTDGGDGGGILGSWTTALLPKTRVLTDDPTFKEPAIDSNDFEQVFRLANPFLNEASIGMKDKNLYDASHPSTTEDTFGLYFNYPSIPVGLQLVRSITPPTVPREDFVAFYLSGLSGVNESASGAEILRLNISNPPIAPADQGNLGVLGGDCSGFPNGRRPGDDVIDVSIRVLEGVLCQVNQSDDPDLNGNPCAPAGGWTFCGPDDAESGDEPYTDQAWVDATMFGDEFPYLNTPIPGSTVVLSDDSSEAEYAPPRVFSAVLAMDENNATPSGACSMMVTPGTGRLGGTCVYDYDVDAGGASGAFITGTACNAVSLESPIFFDCELDEDQLNELYRERLSVTVGLAGGDEIGGRLR